MAGANSSARKEELAWDGRVGLTEKGVLEAEKSVVLVGGHLV